MVILGIQAKEGCKIICRPPTIVGDQLRRGGKCVGLNPLSRTIQGNDPGTSACPPSGVWHWVTLLQDMEFHKPT